VSALIFDCDGVLADTERDGHLRSFNETFEFFDLPVRWSADDYAEKLKIGGGKERLKSLLTPDFIADAQLSDDAAAQSEAIAAWHKHKTDVYTSLVEQGVMPGRPGIARIVREAHAAGWTLAVASTSHERSVRAVLTHAVGDELAASFAVFAGDVVPKKKPAPDIYVLALRELGLSTDDVIVIEDSQNGLEAAVAADLRTVVTVSSFTRDEDFSGASLVVTSLGDPPTEDTTVLSNPLGLDVGSAVTLADLTDILAMPLQVRQPAASR
jgi:HAD superfamily hydrolase (TIGR01509 family)